MVAWLLILKKKESVLFWTVWSIQRNISYMMYQYISKVTVYWIIYNEHYQYDMIDTIYNNAYLIKYQLANEILKYIWNR